ncbi:MFS transporter [Bradyrhizobium sp. SYSU BS000235]|uniref:MFS transporter n=1 Tax=Bradyrhizobium sp. SYSU BS000235 TaxID=3411332 RepID=UPI003C719080
MSTVLQTKTTSGGRIFYGWWIVFGCLLVAVVGWSLTVFGMGVYIHALSERPGFSISLISTAVTVSYLVNAVCLISVGTATTRLGPKLVFAAGAGILALTVPALAYCEQAWQVFLIFAVMGLGRACLSTTSISTTLAPWFERHQGRAVSMALLGASIGGMIGTPLLLGGMTVFGEKTAFILAGASSLLVVLPVVLFVLKRTPQEMGLLPDGEAPATDRATKTEAFWSRKGAMATRQFYSQLIAFALSLMVQIGFLSHHVSLVAPKLGDQGASIAVSSAALAAFIGRIALARFADRVDLRLTTAGVLLVAAASLAAMAMTSSAEGLLLTSVCYGLTIGNLTTLSPIIARREFGAASFGAVYGVAASVIAIATAFGPGLFGILRDTFNSYGPALVVAALLNLVAAIIIVWGGRKPLPSPS